MQTSKYAVVNITKAVFGTFRTFFLGHVIYLPERILEHLPSDWGEGWDNVWLGASVGSQKGMQRIFDLLKVPTKVRFLSMEPLHERVDMNIDITDLCKLDWVIIGGAGGTHTGTASMPRVCFGVSMGDNEQEYNQCRP